jgi:hypothetical protein
MGSDFAEERKRRVYLKALKQHFQECGHAEEMNKVGSQALVVLVASVLDACT